MKSIIRTMLFWLIFTAILYFSSSLLLHLFTGKTERFAFGVIGSIVGYLVIWGFLKIDKSTFREIGLVWESRTFTRFFKGILIGTVIFLISLLLLKNFTELQFQHNPGGIDSTTMLGYLIFFPLALMEELAFRSYPIIKLKKRYGIWITQFIVATAFALYHIVYGWSVYNAFSGPFVWAFVFGIAAVWSAGIAMPLGIHFAVNILQPLTGMKGEEHSLWILDYKAGTPEKLIAHTGSVLLFIQILIFAGAVIFTAIYLRRVHNLEKGDIDRKIDKDI
jgi:uncharacterized protein